MMKKPKLLFLDAAINLILGILLIIFSNKIVSAAGVPESSTKFYPNILGAIFIGITIALVIEYYRRPGTPAGLGLSGAIAINLCGGVMLIIWLISGGSSFHSRGLIILWILAIILVSISIFEWIAGRAHKQVYRHDK
jgi:hypothetical protein